MLTESKESSEVLQLQNNLIPKGLIPLEKLFDQNDVFKAPRLQANEEEVENCNLGDSVVPKIVKISKFLSADMKTKYVEMMKRFIDVFAWSYADLKQYDSSIIQHTIPIKQNEKPFKQKLRRINPLLMPLIEKEVKKLFDAKIIVPIRFSNWLANLVPVRKKNGEIRICIDFRNLNKASLKDNYPLPKMDFILQNIVGSQRMSMLDGFSGYNQILVHPDDQEKIAFTTPWGTFMYAKMPFGLMNAGATFQRAMDIAFAEEKDKSVVVYLDDITVFSKREEDHLKHLEKVLLKCRRFGISLNPTKSIFALTSGKLLGHIISEEGIRIDPNRVNAIKKLDLPRSKKEIQSFLGKVNFVRRFIPNFAEVVKNITKMLKKGADFKWTAEVKKSFEEIKKALTQAPVLISLNFTKEFLIFTFASEDTIAGVLLQKGSQGTEQPISFFSKTLANAELKYNILEKQAYALVKAIKDFRIYVLHSHIVAYVPNAVIKDILTQADPDGKRGKWIAKLLEYDIEIKPTKLVKGQGLAKLLT